MNRELKHQPGPIMALDTATASMAAAIVDGHEVLAEIQSLAERNHSVHIVTNLQELLVRSGLEGKDLTAIAVGNGPGSYTGMRIAVAAAKTLAWVWNKPLVAVSSLEGIAFGAYHTRLDFHGLETADVSIRAAEKEEQDASGKLSDEALEASQHGEAGTDWVIPIMDARRGQVYTSAFAMSGGQWGRLAEDGVRMMNGWVDRLVEQLHQANGTVRSVALTGDLALHEAQAQRLMELGQEAGVIVTVQPFVQEGKWIARLGRARLEAGLTENPHTLVPNYTQLTEAEVNWKAKQTTGGTAL